MLGSITWWHQAQPHPPEGTPGTPTHALSYLTILEAAFLNMSKSIVKNKNMARANFRFRVILGWQGEGAHWGRDAESYLRLVNCLFLKLNGRTWIFSPLRLLSLLFSLTSSSSCPPSSFPDISACSKVWYTLTLFENLNEVWIFLTLRKTILVVTSA